MTSNFLKTLLSLVFLINLGACATSATYNADKNPLVNTETNINAIKALYLNWNIAVETGNRQGYLDILDDQIRMIPPGANDILGKKDYGEFLIPVFENAGYKIIYLDNLEIDLVSDDIALVRYDYVIEIAMRNNVKTITDSKAALDQASNNMKYHDVLKRQADGSWRVLRHMWTPGIARD